MDKKETGLLKQGQITLFVILALFIIASIIIIFSIMKGPSAGEGAEPYVSPGDDPKLYIQKCARDATREVFNEIIVHGGFRTPKNYVKKSDVPIELICYTGSNYQLCNNVHPVLEREMEKEMEGYVKPILEKCFQEVKASKSGLDYQEGELNFGIVILPGQIAININKDISYGRNEQRISLDNFDTKINSPAFDFVRISKDIINQEVSCNCMAETCNANLARLNSDFRDYTITKPVYSGNGEEIYVIKERISGKEFNFAIRNCVRFP